MNIMKPMNRMIALVVLGEILTGAATFVCAQTVGTNQVVLPSDKAGALSDADDEVQQAARYSLAQGVVWLKQRAVTDPDGWIIGPNRVIKVIGTTNVTIRYNMLKVWHPVYSYSNEAPIVTFVQDTVGAPLRKVVHVPQRRIKQIGSNLVEQVSWDVNGSYSKVVPSPLYDPSGGVAWSACGIGDAALAAYALQQAGVPASDPVFDGVVRNIQNHIRTYGLPDQTWNLAWLTAVFAGIPDKTAADITQRLAARLLDGQILSLIHI